MLTRPVPRETHRSAGSRAVGPSTGSFSSSRWSPRHLLVVVLGLAVPTSWAWWSRVSRVSDGTLVLPTPGMQVVRLNAVYQPHSTLRAGDTVRAVDGVPMDRWVSGRGPAADRSVGDTLTYTVSRHGRTFDTVVRLTHYPLASAVRSAGVLLVLVVVLLAVVSVVYVIRPRDPAARLMFVVGVMLPCVITEYPLGLQAVDLAGGAGVFSYVGADLAACVLWSATLHFTLVFPEPTPLLRRRRWLGPSCYALPFVLWLLSWSWALPSVTTPLGRLFVLVTISTTAARVVPVLIGCRLVVSYRSSRDPDARRRLRWIGVTLLVGFAGYIVLGQLPELFGADPVLAYKYLLLLLIPVPLAVGAAILRYRLFDIEVILTRSLLLGGLSAGVAIMYAAVVVLLPRLGTHPSTLVALLLGSAIAAAAFTLRRSVTRRITRLIYGDRDDPHEVISQLSALTSVAQTETVLPDVVRTLATTLRLSYVRLDLLAVDGSVAASAVHGQLIRSPTTLPITDGLELLGRLELDAGAGREPFGPADRRLLEDLARQLVGAARTLSLARDLQQSRERIVLSREEERRRLRRDLHDGVGPSLAAQSMQLDLAGSLIPKDPDRARLLIDGLSASTQGILGDIRQIVEDLRPAVLDQFGLVSAIREHTMRFDRPSGEGRAHAFWVEVVAPDDLGDLPAAVEVAAFRIAVEAVSNASRYSGARHCEVRLHRAADLVLTVVDDGVGLQPRVQGTGVGLVSMRERAAELGGDCAIQSGPNGVGTVVDVRLPLRGTRSPSAPSEGER